MKLRCALPLAFTIFAAAAPSGQPDRFALAIVRLDGAIVPFAAHDGGRWERAWPAADEAIEPTPTIDGTPSGWRKRGARVPRVWTVWPAAGLRSTQARVTGIQVADTHCGGQLALKTDLRPIKAEHPGTFGVAVDSHVQIGAAEKLNESSSAWKGAAQVVISNFASLEAAQAHKDLQELPHETPQPAARITALYRESNSSRSAMYFVAEKKYRTPSFPQDPACERITIMTGWLLPTSDGALTLRDAKMFVTDCDEKEVRTGLPLATVHVSNHVFWVLQEHGYEDETYVIAEIGRSDVSYPMTVNGGGC